MNAGGLQHFDCLFATEADPWRYRSSWYERRKRQVALAALPEQTYAHAFEPGCANGEFTAALAERCTRVLAADASAQALTHARSRVASLPNVSLQRLVIPAQWPAVAFDLLVIGELAYYLDAGGFEQLLSRCFAEAEGPVTVLACHWRRREPDFHRSGDDVHAGMHHAATDAGWSPAVRHVETDFLLDVWRAPLR